MISRLGILPLIEFEHNSRKLGFMYLCIYIREDWISNILSSPSMWGLKARELHKYGTDITASAQMGKLDPVIGRKEELELLIGALMKKRNSNACLVGGPGVGKTAIVEALAHKIARNSVPNELKGKKVRKYSYIHMVLCSSHQIRDVSKRLLIIHCVCLLQYL